MEVAIILSSLAGAAAAATVGKLPKSKKPVLLGANSQIKAQIESLCVEKEILTKTISRLYLDDAGLTKIQRDRLLSRYQHQLGVILARIEKLQEASRYPDLGPLGEGLMSLMDQKLASLDKKLIEISSKISAGQKQDQQKEAKKAKENETQALPKQPEKPHQEKQVVGSESINEMIDSFAKAKKKLELTTLTEIPQGAPRPPEILAKEPEIHLVTQPLAQTPNTINPKAELVNQQITRLHQKESQLVESTPQQERTQKATHQEPHQEPKEKEIEEQQMDSDEDDLDSIKQEILKTLSKLEQAEVE